MCQIYIFLYKYIIFLVRHLHIHSVNDKIKIVWFQTEKSQDYTNKGG